VEKQELFRKALDEPPEDTRRNVIRSEKTIIENKGFLLYQPPKIWEKAWQDNINNYDKLVLYGVCENKECSRQYPVVASY
jgi:hypothetical protein